MDGLPEKKAIVVVEDNEAIAELIKDLLNAEPEYQAVAVHDGALALDVIRSVKASLILLDVGLPGLDGLQVYDMIKEDPTTTDIPVIFVTADPDNHHFKKRDIRQYIAKPFELDDLLARVAAICRPDA
jgi:DNA-binding response OmpR family regulator